MDTDSAARRNAWGGRDLVARACHPWPARERQHRARRIV